MPVDSLTVDKVCALADDRFQELLDDGTIHPKMKRGAMVVHAAQESQERDLAFGGSWSHPARDRACTGSVRHLGGLMCDSVVV